MPGCAVASGSYLFGYKQGIVSQRANQSLVGSHIFGSPVNQAAGETQTADGMNYVAYDKGDAWGELVDGCLLRQ